MAVSDTGARRRLTGRHDRRGQRQGGPQVVGRAGRIDAEEPRADAMQVISGCGAGERRRGGGEVQKVRTQGAPTGGADRVVEHQPLAHVLAAPRVVGTGQVPHDAHDAHGTRALVLPREGAQRRPLARRAAVATGADIDVQVKAGHGPRRLRCCGDREEQLEIRDREIDARSQRRLDVGVRRVEPAQDRSVDARAAQRERLVDAGHADRSRPRLENRGDDVPVPERVGLEDRHQPAPGEGMEPRGVLAERVLMDDEFRSRRSHGTSQPSPGLPGRIRLSIRGRYAHAPAARRQSSPSDSGRTTTRRRSRIHTRPLSRCSARVANR